MPAAAAIAARRSAGILLHPTSLPGRFGIGDIGAQAVSFLDWAHLAGLSLWQVLPLGPTGAGNSPYSSPSAFAGNPLLLSPERLLEEGFVAKEDLEAVPELPAGKVDFAAVEAFKGALLERAWRRQRARPPGALAAEIEAFAAEPGRTGWLEDWTLYAALKARHGGAPWVAWPRELRLRERSVLAAARAALTDELARHRFVQFLFHRQWARLRAEARRRRIQVLGDAPIYVSLDSADVWANQHLFELDEEARPQAVAGVPPDYFSADGQLWGNPLYRWERMAEDGYSWWVARVRENLRQFDRLRIDHFRAFASYWEVPAAARSAREGRWRPGPGIDFFARLRDALGELPLVAEDLGEITEDVRELRRAVGLPGTRVLQFGFAAEPNEHHPARIEADTLAYTGTHDNDTTRGWFAALAAADRQRVLGQLGTSGAEIHWDLIEAAYASAADTAVVPVQDVFGLGAEARMNDPSLKRPSWVFRARLEQFRQDAAERLRTLGERTGRLAPVE